MGPIFNVVYWFLALVFLLIAIGGASFHKMVEAYWEELILPWGLSRDTGTRFEASDE